MKSESTENYITYHHNWYDHSDSRHPRIRTCSVHCYNNYFDGNAKYGVGVTMGASAFVENNYFRNCKNPMMSSGQGTDALGEGTFSGETGGIIKAYNNHIEGAASYITYAQDNTSFDAYEVSSPTETVPSSVVTASGSTTYNNFDTDSSLMYSYTADAAEDVPSIVTAKAGRADGGDFQWEFDNSVDDASYAVNDGLKAALTITPPPFLQSAAASQQTVPLLPQPLQRRHRTLQRRQLRKRQPSQSRQPFQILQRTAIFSVPRPDLAAVRVQVSQPTFTQQFPHLHRDTPSICWAVHMNSQSRF